MKDCQKKPGDSYMQKSSRSVYIACEHYDFCWDRKEVQRFREMWEEGVSLPEMAFELGRHINEVFILALDQAEQGKIEWRPGGVYGIELKKAA